MNNRIQMLSGRRFLSHHIGAEVYYDSRHRVIKASFTGGGHGELIKELQPNGSYRNQILFIVSPEGKRSTIEFTLNDNNKYIKDSNLFNPSDLKGKYADILQCRQLDRLHYSENQEGLPIADVEPRKGNTTEQG